MGSAFERGYWSFFPTGITIGQLLSSRMYFKFWGLSNTLQNTYSFLSPDIGKCEICDARCLYLSHWGGFQLLAYIYSCETQIC